MEILDIWRPGAGLARTWDSVTRIPDIVGNSCWMATRLSCGLRCDSDRAWRLLLCRRSRAQLVSVVDAVSVCG